MCLLSYGVQIRGEVPRALEEPTRIAWLPIFRIYRTLLTQTALRGNSKVIQLPVGGNELDLLDYLSNQKSEIQTIVKEQARSGPVKIGMSACVKMMKDLETSIGREWMEVREFFKIWDKVRKICANSSWFLHCATTKVWIRAITAQHSQL